MSKEKLYVKNMVCNCCKVVLGLELEKLGIKPVAVELGEIYLKEKLNETKKERLNEALQPLGLSLIDDRKVKLIEDVKDRITELVYCGDSELKVNLSSYIGDTIHLEYNYISNLFSKMEGITIEKYFISQKVEKVKEILMCGDLTISEIACKLNYSSVAYLSTQFKKVTGLTPSDFRKSKLKRRIPLNEL